MCCIHKYVMFSDMECPIMNYFIKNCIDIVKVKYPKNISTRTVDFLLNAWLHEIKKN